MRGFDPDSLEQRDERLIRAVLPLAERLARGYFRLQVTGDEHLPAGPCLFVANHNGGIMGPDLFCTLPALWRRRERPLYAMAHDFPMRHFTPLGRLLQRLGALRACRDNATRAFRAGADVLVYPGGDLDAYRHFRRRDEVVILPRTGFAETARHAGVPIVPVVAAGAHRSAIIFSEGQRLARWLRLHRWGRLDRFPLALALPWGFAPGPWLPYLPLPWPIQLAFLPPIQPTRDAPATATRVQSAMQQALDELTCRS
jgi:1-acyl-sn-glycerol-3-phosphate acyltransferase